MARVTVVGAGITGLAAAWEASSHPGTEVTVLEASARLGGKIATTELDLPGGRLRVDEGADAFLVRVPDAVELCRELGIGDNLTQPLTGEAKVFVDGALRPLPTASVLGVPLDFESLGATGILSAPGLARAARELDHRAGPLTDDVAIGAFLTEHYGPELTAHVVGPLIGGINAGDIERLSLAAVTPQLAEAARDGNSLTEALRRRRSAAPMTGPVFLAPTEGMGLLVDTLVEQCHRRGVDLRTGVTVDDLDDLDADAVVLSTPARAAARLLAPVCPDAARELDTITHASVVLATFAFHNIDVTTHGASGFLVPRDGGLTMTAASFGSNKWSHWDDGRHMIVRASAGHAGDDRPIALDDATLTGALLDDLATTAGVTAEPVAVRISRYRDGFAQYQVGHLDLVDRIDAAVRRDAPRVRVAGSALRGVGIPACIRQGRSAVRDLLASGRS